MNFDEGGPEYRAGIIIGLVFVFAFAAYIILLQHSKAHAQYSEYKPNISSIEDHVKHMSSNMNKHVIMCRQKYNNQDLLYKFCRTSNEDFGVSCKEDMLEYTKYIIKYAIQYNIDPWLFLAIAYHESRFNAYVVGGVGERGIFQINPKNKRARGSKFIHNNRYRNACKAVKGHCQEEVVRLAAIIFNDAVEACGGHTNKALTAYNTGSCAPLKRSYIKLVMEHKNSLMNPNKINIRSCTNNRITDV